MQTKKKQPMRMCVGCREMKERRTLVRIVKSPAGEDGISEISVDPTGKKSGRGAYICRNRECLEKARKAKRLEGAFGCKIDGDIYLALASQLAESEGEEG